MGTMLARTDPEYLLDNALTALAAGRECQAVLDEIAAPVYTTDTEGRVTYWNRACVEFAGREPQLGEDRWCVTWKIYTTTGDLLPHDECPMADAIRAQRIVRDAVAIAERPGGSRRAFRPYPTPLFDREGRMTGAINMLVDVTAEQSEALALQAERCRRLADAMYNRETCKMLGDMADGFGRTAAELERKRPR